ncbi:MAG: M1 family metallopeptidase, partial [Streptosporangiaceae bacterium]
MFHRAALPLVLTASCLVVPASTSSADAFTPGSRGLGDSYFPLEGNGGYNAAHYDLNLSYAPKTDRLAGSVRMTAHATKNLSRFNLDLRGLKVTSVKVNGRRATFSRSGQELRIAPARGLVKGHTFTTTVRYGGVPRTIVGSPIVFGSPYGFLHTPDGAFVGGEPNGASTWFPVNDHPSDKASYKIKITVPKGLGAISNGVLTGRRTQGARTSFTWKQRQPMASYLATIDIGKWKVKSGRTPGGIRNYIAVDPKLRAGSLSYVTKATARATDFWVSTLGPYPFDTTGAIVDDARYRGRPLGFSLETQSKPVYSAVRDTGTIAHELAHQWFGDSVSVKRWKDIWLNESFATWAMYYWLEKKRPGALTVGEQVRADYADWAPVKRYWTVKIADPGRNTMFSSRVYDGGAMVLQFLRERIGD